MKREFSAGGIVFKKEGQEVLFLLVRNQSIKDPSVNYWGFPKGHIEEGESSQQTAVREVKEETGIQSQILERIGQSSYIFTRSDEKVYKNVTLFLMKCDSGELKKQPEEIGEVAWMDFDQAMVVLSFSKDKEFLKKANKILNG